jgi:hypothetical protein
MLKEVPRRSVRLPTFWISRVPLTVRQRRRPRTFARLLAHRRFCARHRIRLGVQIRSPRFLMCKAWWTC